MPLDDFAEDDMQTGEPPAPDLRPEDIDLVEHILAVHSLQYVDGSTTKGTAVRRLFESIRRRMHRTVIGHEQAVARLALAGAQHLLNVGGQAYRGLIDLLARQTPLGTKQTLTQTTSVGFDEQD